MPFWPRSGLRRRWHRQRFVNCRMAPELFCWVNGYLIRRRALIDIEHQMLCARSHRRKRFAALAAFSAVLAFGRVDAALAQEPPVTVPAGGPPSTAGAIPFNGWLLYPSLTVFSQYSDNYFLSPPPKISAVGFGVTPSLIATWSDGINTTTLNGHFQGRDYPTASEINATDGEATFTQTYAPLRDLSFSFAGDYTHQTIAYSLNSSIPAPIITPGTTVLANGNTVLPNGQIVSSTGQIVGQQATSPLVVNGFAIVNPYDQYTASTNVQKIFGDGIVTLGASLTRLDYEQQSSSSLDYTAQTFSESAAFWLGSVFYAYSNGVFAIDTNTFPNPDLDVYRVVGGIGTRQFGLFRASAYFGYQGTEVSGGLGSAAGDVYGAALSYYPTKPLTISATVDRTINISSITVSSSQALSLPGLSPVLIPLSDFTDTTTVGLSTNYVISPQWSVNGTFSYTHIAFIGSSMFEDAWLADTRLNYDIWRNMTLTLEYQYSSIVSNEPLTSANRNFVMMGATYRF